MLLRRSILDAAVVLGLAAALFAIAFHPAMLDPTNVGWLLRGVDNGANALGVQAWHHDPTADWRLFTRLLNAPEGISLFLTDSNPLMTLMSAPLLSALGGGQVVGWWFLLCLVLHVGFATALLRPLAPGRLALWAGVVLLSLLPTLYARTYHANLFAHWLILWALWIFLSPDRARDWRWWAAILVTAALVHQTLLILVAAIWASALVERIVADRSAVPRLAAGAAACLVLVALAVAPHGIGTGYASTESYGSYAMPLDALWNPGVPGLSSLMPVTEQREYRQFEGFQYLGLGLLLALLATPLLLTRTPAAAPIAAVHRRMLWLLPMTLALTVLALSHEVDAAGRPLFTLPLPHKMIDLLDPVRASARLFWPVAYLLALLAITACYRMGARRGGMILGALALVQAADMIPLLRLGQVDAAAAADRRLYLRTADPRWDVAITNASDVIFMPPEATADRQLYHEVAWRAVTAGKPIRHVHAARIKAATLTRLNGEVAAFRAGQLVSGRLYVLLPGTPVPPDAADRLVTLDGVRVLLADRSPP